MQYLRSPGFSQTQRTIHWLSVLLIVVLYITMEFRGMFPKGSDGRALMKAAHFYSGQLVLLLVVARLVLHRLHKTTVTGDPLIKISAGLLHLALLIFLVAMPVLGLSILAYEGKTISFLGLSLPALVAKNHNLAEQLEHWHETGANIGYVLIGLHAGAALFHHSVLKDNVLRMMNPFKRDVSQHQ